MKRSQLLMGLAGLALTACGEEGASDAMRTADGSVNPAGTEIARDVADQELNSDGLADPRRSMDEDAVSNLDRRALLERVLEGEQRSDEAKKRDTFRNPAETLMFFGMAPSDVVVEVWPGSGWYTDILAPYLAAGGGKLYAASFDPDSENARIQTALKRFDDTYLADSETYGDVERTVLAASRQEVAPEGSADMVLTFRNVHNFTMGSWGEEAFSAFYAALKPGGVLGIVEHRLPEDRDVALEKSSGYMKESTVRQLAEDAGFVFDGASEINANPKDDTDHPFGVWTLPPRSVTSDRNGEAPEDFDAAAYKAIGESDRMTLRFVKPETDGEPADALLE